MPPLPRGTVCVSDGRMGGSLASLLQRHRYVLENMNSDVCDFLCGGTSVVYIDDANRLCDVPFREAISRRLVSLTAQTRTSAGRVALLLLVGPMEPRPDVLLWLNLYCSVEMNCGVMLCWSEEECANYLEGLAESCVASVDYRMARKREDAPIPVLIDAFTQTPQLMTRNDVVRAAHRFGSVAALLLAAPDDLTSLPGLGPKKAARLHAVLHAGFHTSRRLVSDVVTETDEIAGDPQRRPGREKMLSVLNQLRSDEMNASVDN